MPDDLFHQTLSKQSGIYVKVLIDAGWGAPLIYLSESPPALLTAFLPNNRHEIGHLEECLVGTPPMNAVSRQCDTCLVTLLHRCTQ